MMVKRIDHTHTRTRENQENQVRSEVPEPSLRDAANSLLRAANSLSNAASRLSESSSWLDSTRESNPAREVSPSTETTGLRLFLRGDEGVFSRNSSETHRRLEELDIDFPHRIKNSQVLEELIKNRENVHQVDNRPLAVIVYPKDDHNGAFEHNQIDQELLKNYRVLYYEADTDKDFLASLEEATTKQPASLLLIGGHGNYSRLAFGEGDPRFSRMGDEEKYLDFSDFAELSKFSWSDSLANNAHIVLQSCSVGEGEDETINLANMLGSLAPHTNIHSVTEPSNTKEFHFDGNGRLWDVEFHTWKEYNIKAHSFTDKIPDHLLAAVFDKKLTLDIVKHGEIRDASKAMRALDNYVDPSLMLYLSEELKQDEEFMLKVARSRRAQVGKYISKQFLSNREIAINIITGMHENFLLLPPSLRNDPDFQIEACLRNSEIVSLLPISKRSDREFLKKILVQYPSAIKYASPDIRGDKDFALWLINNADVKHYHTFFEHFSHDIKTDREVVALATKVNPSFWKHMPIENSEYKTLLKEAIQKSPYLFEGLPPNIQQNEEIARFAIQQRAGNFEHAPLSLRSNRDFVLSLINHEDSHKFIHTIARHMDEALKHDEEVARSCINIRPRTFRYFGEKIRSNRELALKFMKKADYEETRFIGDEWKKDKDFFLDVIRLKGGGAGILPYLDPSIASDLETIEKALELAPKKYAFSFFEHVSDEIKKNRELVLKYIPTSPSLVLRYVHPSLKRDREVVFQALIRDPVAFQHAHKSLKEDPEFVKKIAFTQPMALQTPIDGYIRRTYLKDPEYILKAIKIDPKSMYLNSGLQWDREFVLRAMAVEPKVFDYIPEHFQEDPEVQKLR